MYNANNYGYNPYGRYIPQQPMEQTQQFIPQTKPILNGKQVESIDVVKSMEIPLDGSISYFPLTDGTAIITKQLQMDGTSKTQIFKLTDDKDIKAPKYITMEELNKEINKIDLTDIEDLKEEIKEIKKSIKDLKKKSD